MPSVFVTTYEIIGEGIDIALDHFSAVDKSAARCWKIAESFGALGFRPGSHGVAIRSLFFAAGKVPVGWRKVGREGDNIEAIPNRSTKSGKAAAVDLNPIGLAPPDSAALAAKFGWAPESFIMDGTSIFFPTAQRIPLPTPRYFLRLPRQDGDGWTLPDTLAALPESSLMLAIETHNRLAREAKASKAA